MCLGMCLGACLGMWLGMCLGACLGTSSWACRRGGRSSSGAHFGLGRQEGGCHRRGGRSSSGAPSDWGRQEGGGANAKCRSGFLLRIIDWRWESVGASTRLRLPWPVSA